jgi:mannose-6-phosphate isomerase-like protein (cupin superfamily)
MAEATNGLAGVRVVRPKGASGTPLGTHEGELLFLFVLDGTASLACEGTHRLAPGDAVTIPAGTPHALADCTNDLSLLEVTLPA